MKSALLVLGAAVLLSAPVSPVFGANAAVPQRPIRGEVIISRTDSAWESQQVQEPCILPGGASRRRRENDQINWIMIEKPGIRTDKHRAPA